MPKILSLSVLTDAERRDALSRFVSYSRPAEGCWGWIGAKHPKSKRGTITIASIATTAPRLAYMLFVGDIPDMGGHHGACVCHSCDNPNCVNPAHLFIGSQLDNLTDMRAKGRSKTKTLLTDEQVVAIRRDPRRSREIADVYGVSQSVVCNIKSYKGFARIPPHPEDVPVTLHRKHGY